MLLRPAVPRESLVLERRRVVLACAALLIAPAARATPGEIAVGGILPDAPLRGLNGPSRRLKDYRGRNLLINVWASWCGPCVEEMASLERLAWMEGRPAFAMIGISTDDYEEAARKVLRRQNATITHYIDRDQELENLLGAAHIPLTVLVDARGRVLDKITGAQEWDSPAALGVLEDAFGARAAPRA